MKTNSVFLRLLIISVFLIGCQTSHPSREELQTYHPETHYGSGLTVGEALALDQQRHRQAVEMFNILEQEGRMTVTPSISPLRYPTVTANYSGIDPKGMFDEIKIISDYRKRRLEGDTIVYSTDLASMTLVLEKLVKDEPYEYREVSSTVPYGYCLDFIEENLGKTSEEPKGFTIRKVTCSQDDLGIQF